MLPDLFMTVQARLENSQKFLPLLRNPAIVDPTFGVFASETDFIYDVESLLQDVQTMAGLEPFDKDDEQQYTTEYAVSFISIDIDRQTDLTHKYGDRVARNLSRSVWQRIQRQVGAPLT